MRSNQPDILGVEKGESMTDEKKFPCGYKAKLRVRWYTAGGSTAWGQSPVYSNLFCGFSVNIKCYKKGWTGIYYPKPLQTNNAGYYHSSYNNFTTYNTNVLTKNYTYYLNTGHWYGAGVNPSGFNFWSSNILNSTWAYVHGTVKVSACGTTLSMDYH